MVTSPVKPVYGWTHIPRIFGSFNYWRSNGRSNLRIYKTIIPIIVYFSTTMILLGLVAMYLAGEFALTPDNKKAAKIKGKK